MNKSLLKSTLKFKRDTKRYKLKENNDLYDVRINSPMSILAVKTTKKPSTVIPSPKKPKLYNKRKMVII